MIRVYDNDYFSKEELQCKCCGQLKLHSDFLPRLIKIRIKYGKPIHVNCCYRCPDHNIEVGGAKNSFHKKGMAIDIRNPRNLTDKYNLISLFIEDSWSIGVYNIFFHADIRSVPRVFWGKS